MNRTRQTDFGTPASKNQETVQASHSSTWQEGFAERADQQGRIAEPS